MPPKIGLLDGRTVTTHWARAARLAAEYPAVDVDADPIYRRDGKVWTSAGVTAGIDLALAMVEDDHGSERGPDRRPLAGDVPAPPGRPDASSPRRCGPAAPTAGRARRPVDRIDAQPGADHRVPALAAAAAMSPATSPDCSPSQVGESPGRYVEQVRHRGRPPPAGVRHRHARRRSPRRAGSARPRPSAEPSTAASASPPTATANDSGTDPSR